MDDNRRKKRSSPFSWVIAVIILLLTQGDGIALRAILGLLAMAAVFAIPVVIIFAIARSAKNRSGKSRQEPAFDSCPKTFCFHRDKGEHHVRRGREIDPWDRPDIDIRKYQRNQ